MSVDKAVDSTALDAAITTVADAIRAKTGTTEEMTFPAGMAAAISALRIGQANDLIDSYHVQKFTPSSDVSSAVTFNFSGLSRQPDIVMCCTTHAVYPGTANRDAAGFFLYKSGMFGIRWATSSGNYAGYYYAKASNSNENWYAYLSSSINYGLSTETTTKDSAVYKPYVISGTASRFKAGWDYYIVAVCTKDITEVSV